MKPFWALFLAAGILNPALADGRSRFQSAHIQWQKGRYEEALELFAQLQPDTADAARIAVGKSRCFESLGRWKQAAETLQRFVKEVPENAGVWARLAEVQFQQGQYSEAQKSVEQALKQDSQQPLAHLLSGQILTETGQIDEANREFRWFIRYYNRAQPTDAETLLQVAYGAVQYARWNGNTQIFDFALNTLCPDALQDDRRCWQAHQLAGSLLLEKYNRQQALPEFRRALAINPRARESLVSLGRASFQQHAFEKAERYAKQALNITEDFVPALQLQADIELAQGHYSSALEILGRASVVNPNDQTTLARIAACYLLVDGISNSERFEMLLSNLDAVDEVTPKKGTRFEELVLELARRNPRPGYFLTILASAMESRRKFDAAERLYLQAIDATGRLAEPKTALGMLYMQMGKMKEAKVLLDDAFRADPFHVRVSNMRKVIKLLDGYAVIATDHFVIRVDSQADALLGRYMAEYLEEIYPDMVEQFGFEPPQRTQFEIYHRAKGLSAHQWFSARMVGLPWIQTIGASTGVIVALASPTATDQPFNWARVLKHELVHVFTLQQTKFNIPHWFTEALAVRSEGYPRPAQWNQLLRERVPARDLRDLDTLNDGFQRPESPLDWQFAYCQSRLYAQFMVERYGADSLPRLLDAYQNNMTTDQAIPVVFNTDKATFEKQYLEFLDALVAQMPEGTVEKSESLADLERNYRKNTEDPASAAAYAYALLQRRKRTMARDLATEALDKNPKEPLAALVMARLALRARDSEDAIAYLEPAVLESNPNRHVLMLLAKLKLTHDNFGDAERLYELAIQFFPDNVEFHRGLAAAYLKQHKTDQLRVVLEKLILLDPDDALPRKKLAMLALENKAYAKAIEYSRMALHVDVLDVEIHRVLAEACHASVDFQNAVKEFEIALQLKPEDTESQFGLARALNSAGKRDDAQTHLRAILTRNPENTEARQLLEEWE